MRRRRSENQGKVTLRDARRYIARHPDVLLSYTSGKGEIRWMISLPFPGIPGGGLRSAEALSLLDRLIAKYGPGATEPSSPAEKVATATASAEAEGASPERQQGEAREKGTDAVAPAGDSPSKDSPLHGGDGNSGEVDHPALTSSAEQRDGGGEKGEAQPQQSQLHQGTRVGSDATGGTPDAYHGADASQPETDRELGTQDDAEPAAGEVASKSLNDSDSDLESTASKTPQRDAEGGAMDAASAKEELGGANKSPEGEDSAVTQSRATSRNSRTARRVWGGEHHSERVAERLARSAESRRAAKEVKRALERLLQAVEQGGLEPSPRMDARKLAREIVSRRYGLSRTRRDELTQPLVALLCDVSGSCSAVCDETLAACMGMAEELDHAMVAVHSNGFVAEPKTISDVIAEQHQKVALVVAFGDWDAAGQYQALCESGAKLVWLDSYCAYAGVKPATTGWGSTAHWKRQPLAAYQGVNSAKDAAIAMRAIAKALRGK